MLNQTNPVDKKKRVNTSGSRSKSKKSTNNIKHDHTVELKPKPLHIFHNQDICAKIKTENSLSVNKTKGSRKNSKSFKKSTKQECIIQRGSVKQSKDQSYLVSAQRKHSINKINKTEATHLESEEIFKKLYSIKKQLSKMDIPDNTSITQIQEYFDQIKESYANIQIQPLESIFMQLHSMYVIPINNIFDMIKPYENMLRKRQEYSRLIKEQMQQNQNLYQQLDPQDIEIIKLKEEISKKAVLIQTKRKKKQSPKSQFSMKKKKAHLHSEAIKVFNQSGEQQTPDINYQFQMKLGKQYDKIPKFKQEQPTKTQQLLEQKRTNNFLGKKKEHANYTFSQALKSNIDKQIHAEDAIVVVQSQRRASQEGQSIGLRDQNQRQQAEQFSERQLQIYQVQKLDQNSNKTGLKSGGLSFNFKLDIPKIDRNNVGFHEQFYSKLDQFSQSWRNQALRQKRF